MSTLRVAVVDDHDAVRRGLSDLLDAHGLEIVGEASNGEEAVFLCRRTRPDVVVMDVRMPVLDGIQATRRIKDIEPSTRVLLLTAYEQEELRDAAFAAGADAFVLKGTSGAELAQLVRDSGKETRQCATH